MKTLNSILGISLFSTLVLVSCGESSLRSKQELVQSEPQSSTSQLIFGALNSSVAGNIAAAGNISIDGGIILVDLESTGHTAGTEHMQKVFNVERCPVDSDDANGDGLVDYQEAIGNASVVLPLTTTLTEEGEYPKSTEDGYTFKTSADSTLKSNDLDKKAVIIFGVGSDKELPETVAAAPGMDAHASLPVACSVIALEEDQDQTTTTGTTTTGTTTDDTTSTGDTDTTTTGTDGTTSTTGDQHQTTGGKGGYQEQTTGGKGGYQEQTTGGKGGFQDQTTGGKDWDDQQQTTGHQQQQDQQDQQQQQQNQQQQNQQQQQDQKEQETALGGDFFTL